MHSIPQSFFSAPTIKIYIYLSFIFKISFSFSLPSKLAKQARIMGKIVLLFFFLISVPLAHSHLHSHFQISGTSQAAKKLRPWPCCNSCGGCTKSIPPQCQCLDLVPSCHPMCQNCVKSPLSVDPPLYQCMDRIPNYCKYNCGSVLNQ